jgi:hypothetical protein
MFTGLRGGHHHCCRRRTIDDGNYPDDFLTRPGIHIHIGAHD